MIVRALFVLGLLVAVAVPAVAHDARQTFRKGTVVLSVEGGYGEQDNITEFPDDPGLEFWNAGVRASLLPFAPFEAGPLFGTLELGVEPYYQRYLHPYEAYFAGLGGTVRYHFLALGRVVPYAEVMAAAGRTTLRTVEIDSEFTFLLHAGIGLALFLTDNTALYAGYRFQHVSNGNTSDPNRGFESRSGVLGVSVFLP
ncbi:MAG: acyloxyacyl hydrolase [Candidatus Rokubacteria bacterium]|nr:acyloxyacyl hydrolase [Candidatus Rokubacteria bacterium]